MAKFRPLHDRVVLRRLTAEEKTSGGIILTRETVQKDQMAEQKATIVALGDCVWRDEPKPRANVGDRVLFSKWAGYQLAGPADGETYRVVNDSDIFMVIEAEK